MTTPSSGGLWIDERDFLWWGDYRLPMRLVDERLQFCDKDRIRSQERGTRYVEVPCVQLTELLKKLEQS